MSKISTFDRLRNAGVIAVLRAPSADACIAAVDALVAGGVTGIEVTYSTPGAPEVIAEVARRHGDRVVLGAGTLRTAEQAQTAAEAGAEFLVSPGTEADLAGFMRASGLVTCLGALTPSEVMSAQRLGADIVKIFPASLGGPDYLRSLRGPFPEVSLMPTGGVSSTNIGEWLAAGAVVVGAGGELCPISAMVAGDWGVIQEHAREFRSALDATRVLTA